jgi:hypothetical protein
MHTTVYDTVGTLCAEESAVNVQLHGRSEVARLPRKEHGITEPVGADPVSLGKRYGSFGRRDPTHRHPQSYSAQATDPQPTSTACREL